MPPCSGGRVAQTQSDRRALFEREALPLMEVLYGGALKLTRNPRDAEDLVQDTYVRAFERFHLFKPGTNLKAWMFRVMTNRFINLYRSRKARPGVTGVENLENHGIEDDGVLLRDFQSSEALASLMKQPAFLDSLDDRLKQGLQALAADYREVLVMNVIGGMAYKEIAEAMSIPVGTVMSRLSRAKAILREKLTSLGQEVIPGVSEAKG